MCCDGWDNSNEDEGNECPTCGEPVDEYGEALIGCNYSPVICPTCGDAPCNESC